MNPPVLNSKSSSGILPESIVQWTNESADKLLRNLEYPKASDEIWRKFPLAQLDLNELSKNANHITIEEMDGEWELTEKKVATAKSMLDSILTSAEGNFFALYTLKHTNQIYFYDLDQSTSEAEFHSFQSQLTSEQNGIVVLLVSVSPNTFVKIKESYLASSNTNGLHLLLTMSCYFLKEGSKLDVLVEESYDENLFHFRFMFSQQESNSNLNLYSFPRGGYRGKQFYSPELNGNGATYQLQGVSSLIRRELLDIDAKVTHLADHTSSKISYKAIVNDRAHHIFTGNLVIPSHVKKAIAHQESHNLSLNKRARAEANPKLEVFAEDVFCTHGATVGDIDEEQLFYLLSRGLSPNEAKSLLVSAFYEETIFKIPFPEIEKHRISENIRKSVLGN